MHFSQMSTIQLVADLNVEWLTTVSVIRKNSGNFNRAGRPFGTYLHPRLCLFIFETYDENEQVRNTCERRRDVKIRIYPRPFTPPPFRDILPRMNRIRTRWVQRCRSWRLGGLSQPLSKYVGEVTLFLTP